MRFLVFSFILFAGLWPARLPASTFYVDLNTLGTVGILTGPCYCGIGPIFAFWSLPTEARTGDLVDFGQVTIQSVFDSHSFGRQDPIVLQYYNDHPEALAAAERQSNYQATVSVSYAPTAFLTASGYTGDPLGSSQTFSLLFEIYDGEQGIQLGWASSGAYTAPNAIASIPEPFTWAMLVIGFPFSRSLRRSTPIAQRFRIEPIGIFSH